MKRQTVSQIDNKLLDSNESNEHLLFGDFSKDTETNTKTLNTTVNYVLTTKRFDEDDSFKNVIFYKMLRLSISLFLSLSRFVIIYFEFFNFPFPGIFINYLVFSCCVFLV